ncbi:hypothetical protein LRP31_25510 [Mesorhizobium mediterraneum]|uniref:IS110 family transposase n=1 Tax=Mesorhizobium mediterraneum TaxID=43617 RepID=A0AB36R8E3_9HYPH|nr:hypothetical protein [Mesorhizobium mediterraneum]PAQ00918.1 hypothetical protein CIT25_17785 [Mesorhizobium mediterraneum]WIW52380.1 hypothetical protein LRP31_25510 [Mesorhizobium mediterraneum]
MQPDLCASIRYHHRQRVYAMEQRKRADLALGSFLRMMLGWSLALPKEDQDAIRARSAELLKSGGEGTEWAHIIEASVQSRKPFDDIEAAALKEMKALACQLPVWSEFGQGVRGFGEASLAIIVAEAGDLSLYPKKGHLWKRMGVAVIDGERQGGLPKNAHKEDWIEHGYNRQRRSRMWTIGDTLIKAQGPYREVYLARKEYERQRAEELGLIVAPSAKIPAKRADEFMSDGHIHRRAQRYMEKRLLRDLWQAWNHQKAILLVPLAA